MPTTRHQTGHFVSRIYKHPTTGQPKLLIQTPDKVLKIHSIEELRAQLAHYALGEGGAVVFLRDTPPHQKRTYVELLRPALRYYCTKFGVAIPAWLDVKADAQFTTDLSEAERHRLYGVTKIKPQEFRKIKTKPPAEEGADGPHA